jgi:hypothetical protein
MAASVSAPSDPSRDQLLADLLASFTEEARCGRQPDLDAAAARHPEVADELRQLWATVHLQGPPAQPQPHRGPQDDPARRASDAG